MIVRMIIIEKIDCELIQVHEKPGSWQ